MSQFIAICAGDQAGAIAIGEEYNVTFMNKKCLHVEQGDEFECDTFVYEVDDYGDVEGDDELIENHYTIGLTGEIRML